MRSLSATLYTQQWKGWEASVIVLSATPAVTVPAEERHCPLASTKLYCLVTEARGCKQLPKVVTWQSGGRGSNSQPLSHQSDALASRLLSHQNLWKINYSVLIVTPSYSWWQNAMLCHHRWSGMANRMLSAAHIGEQSLVCRSRACSLSWSWQRTRCGTQFNESGRTRPLHCTVAHEYIHWHTIWRLSLVRVLLQFGSWFSYDFWFFHSDFIWSVTASLSCFFVVFPLIFFREIYCFYLCFFKDIFSLR